MSSWLLLGPLLLVTSATGPEAPPGRATLLRGEVVDADTGRPISCRVSIRGEDGSWFFPESESPQGSAIPYRKTAIGEPRIVEMHTTLSAHPFGVRLPEGRYVLTAERGKEYHPEQREVAVGTKPVRLSVRLRRWIDMAGRGWYSGDTHVHRTLDELPSVMLAEDLNVASPLTDWVREAFVPPVDRRAASFRDPGPGPIRINGTHLIVPRNTEYEIFTVGKERHTLGAFFVLNHKTPLDLGVPPVGPVARRAHDEGALIELDKHNWPWSMALVPVMPVDLFELSNNHVWETEFAFRDFGESPAPYMNVEHDAKGFTERGWIHLGFQNYYALLDCGFRLRPTAGTASGVHPVPLGFGRVYVRLDGGLDAAAWLKGLDAGRSFVTTGPMLFVTLDGHDPGHRFERTDAAAREYRLAGSAESAAPLGRIEVVVNGEVARTLKPANRPTDRGSYESSIEASLPIDATSWVAVRCFEDRPDGRVRFAHSGPFHIEVPGKPLRPRKDEVTYLVRRVEEQITRSAGVIPAPALDEYRAALRAYRAIAETAR
jgi:hypothetical protein